MKLKTGTAFVIMIVLIIGSVLFGAYKGWSEEKAHVDATYAGLESMLQTRVETAYNILAVAKRHVPETDEAYQRVSMDLGQLDNAYSDLGRKAEANDALGRDAAALLKTLAELDTVKNDSRDKMYVDNYLPQMLSESEQMTVGATYNQAATAPSAASWPSSWALSPPKSLTRSKKGGGQNACRSYPCACSGADAVHRPGRARLCGNQVSSPPPGNRGRPGRGAGRENHH